LRIFQLIPALDYGDAVSQDAVQLHFYLQEMGYESKICAMFHDPRMGKYCSPLEECQGTPDDLLLFHFHYDNDLIPIAESFPGKRAVIYHNITPAEYFKETNAEVYYHCTRGREQLKELPFLFDAGIGDSDFNRQELESVGFKQTKVLPIALNIEQMRNEASDAAYEKKFRDGKTNILFVGRVAPNKKQDDLIRFFKIYKEKYNPDSRLILAGKYEDDDPYYLSLVKLVEENQLKDAVLLTGKVSRDELIALYKTANLFISASEHEGFCVPVVESFVHGVPVLAYPAGAVPETLGEGGFLFNVKDGESVSALMHKILSDKELQAEAAERQNRELERYQPERMKEELHSIIDFCMSAGETQDIAYRDLQVSVVVCSLQRPELLRHTLRGLSRQTHPHLEVIVVHDPTDKETLAVLDAYPKAKRVPTDKNNLSISRNLGIMAAAGDIVAFQDDDAVADPHWAADLVEGYRNPRVGAVGGIVYQGTNKDVVQFARGKITRFAQSLPVNPASINPDDPQGEFFNYLMGTNCSFRKKLLEEAGGFDEHIHFFADDGDICTRLIQKGYKVHHHPRAIMYHHFAKGFIRESEQDWRFDIIIHDNFYFSIKHRNRNLLYVMAKNLWRNYLRFWIMVFLRQKGARNPASICKFIYRSLKGILWGWGAGLFISPRYQSKEKLHNPEAVFQPFNEAALLSIEVKDRPLRIVMTSQNYPPASFGGIATYTQDLAREMVKMGHEVHVITSTYPSYWDEGVQIHPLNNKGTLPFELPQEYHVTRKNLAYGFALHKRIMELFRMDPPDVVETPIWDSEGLVYTRQKIAPMVLRLSSPLKKMIETHQWTADPDLTLSAELEKKLIESSDGIIAISNSIFNTIRTEYQVSYNGIPNRIIPLGIKLPEGVTELPRHHGSSSVQVLFLGRLERRKGIHNLLEAIPMVYKQMQDIDFVIVGKDTPDYTNGKFFRDSFTENYSHEPWFSKVQFTGEVDDKSKWAHYAQCDIFTSPSLYESFGLIFLEAMALGKPVIGTRGGAVPETVHDGKTGLLVEPDNSQELAQAILRLAKDAQLRKTMGEEALKSVETEFSIRKAAEGTISFYRETIARGKKR